VVDCLQPRGVEPVDLQSTPAGFPPGVEQRCPGDVVALVTRRCIDPDHQVVDRGRQIIPTTPPGRKGLQALAQQVHGFYFVEVFGSGGAAAGGTEEIKDEGIWHVDRYESGDRKK